MTIKVIIALITCILSISGIGYLYYTHTQDIISNLEKNNTALKLSNDTNIKTIESIKQNIKDSNEFIAQVNQKMNEIRTINHDAIEKQNQHDLKELSIKKTKLIEKIINRATARVNRCFELLSGAKLTEQELNAKSASEFNSECEYLWNRS